MKESCAWQTLGFIRQTKGKSLIVPVQTEIDFVLVGEKYRKYIRDVKVIPWGLQRRLVVVDLVKKVLKKVARKQQIIRRKIWKLNEKQTKVRFEKRVKELVSNEEKSEGGICIFRGIRSKSWCTSRICAVATIVCNSCERYYRK